MWTRDSFLTRAWSTTQLRTLEHEDVVPAVPARYGAVYREAVLLAHVIECFQLARVAWDDVHKPATPQGASSYTDDVFYTSFLTGVRSSLLPQDWRRRLIDAAPSLSQC